MGFSQEEFPSSRDIRIKDNLILQSGFFRGYVIGIWIFSKKLDQATSLYGWGAGAASYKAPPLFGPEATPCVRLAEACGPDDGAPALRGLA